MNAACHDNPVPPATEGGSGTGMDSSPGADAAGVPEGSAAPDGTTLCQAPGGPCIAGEVADAAFSDHAIDSSSEADTGVDGAEAGPDGDASSASDASGGDDAPCFGSVTSATSATGCDEGHYGCDGGLTGGLTCFIPSPWKACLDPSGANSCMCQPSNGASYDFTCAGSWADPVGCCFTNAPFRSQAAMADVPLGAIGVACTTQSQCVGTGSDFGPDAGWSGSPFGCQCGYPPAGEALCLATNTVLPKCALSSSCGPDAGANYASLDMTPGCQ